MADFGGGTSDFSKIDINATLIGGEDIVRYELAGRNITGLQQFGGQDITKTIQMDFMNQIKQSIGKKWNKLQSEDIEDLELRLFQEAETVKHFLCNSVSFERRFRFEKANYMLIMTQSRLKEINKHHIETITKEVLNCIDGDNIDQLFFVGGSAEVPFVIETVTQLVSDKCEIVRINNKRDLVARGASIIQFIRNQTDPFISFQQINSFDLGFGCSDGTMVPLISRGDSIPFHQTKPRDYKNPDTNDHCWLNIYEGNSPFTAQCNLIGSQKVPFGKVHKARKYLMKVTAELDNYGILKTSVKPSSDLSKVLAIFTMDLGSQGKFGCESVEKKEEYAQSRKQFQETRRKIDNYQDEYFCLLPKLIANGAESRLIKKWDKWRKNITCLEEWDQLIKSMKAILITYENTNDENSNESDDEAEMNIDSDSDGMSQLIDEEEIQTSDVPDAPNESKTESDHNHNKKSVQNKTNSSVDDQTTSKITKPTISEDQTESQNNNDHNKNDKNKKFHPSPSTNVVIKNEVDNNNVKKDGHKKTVQFQHPIEEIITETIDVDENNHESTSDIIVQRQRKRRSKRIAQIKR